MTDVIKIVDIQDKSCQIGMDPNGCPDLLILRDDGQAVPDNLLTVLPSSFQSPYSEACLPVRGEKRVSPVL